MDIGVTIEKRFIQNEITENKDSLIEKKKWLVL